ncbi:hypothetical protein BU15DRAFT_61086 [Melanogaster broomeanus]|nr:hypothetical protein BU15DRAFT_61086 [Melanogaster broomeanus]
MFPSEFLIDDGSSMDVSRNYPGLTIEELGFTGLDWYHEIDESDHTNQTAFELPPVYASPPESPPHSPAIVHFSLPNADITGLSDIASTRYDLLNEAIDRRMTVEEGLIPEYIEVVLPLAVVPGHPLRIEEVPVMTAMDSINFMKALIFSVRTEARQFRDEIYTRTLAIVHSYDNPFHVGVFPFPELCTHEFRLQLTAALTVSANGLPLLHQAGTTPDLVWFGNTALQTIVQRALYDPTYFGWFAFMTENQVFNSRGVPLWVPLAKASSFQLAYTLSWIVSVSKLRLGTIADVEGPLTAYPPLPSTPTRELIAEVNANTKVLTAYISKTQHINVTLILEYSWCFQRIPQRPRGDRADPSQAASPTLSEIPSSSSAVSEADSRRKLAIFNANIHRSYFRRGITSQGLRPRQQKAQIWHQALKKKKDLAFQMLETQKVIEKVEDEVAQHLTRDTIKCERLAIAQHPSPTNLVTEMRETGNSTAPIANETWSQKCERLGIAQHPAPTNLVTEMRETGNSAAPMPFGSHVDLYVLGGLSRSHVVLVSHCQRQFSLFNPGIRVTMARTKQTAKKTTGGEARCIIINPKSSRLLCISPLRRPAQEPNLKANRPIRPRRAEAGSVLPVQVSSRPCFQAMMSRSVDRLDHRNNDLRAAACYKCIQIPTQSYTIVAEPTVMYICVTCHWKDDLRTGTVTPYKGFYRDGKSVLLSFPIINGHFELSIKSYIHSKRVAVVHLRLHTIPAGGPVDILEEFLRPYYLHSGELYTILFAISNHTDNDRGDLFLGEHRKKDISSTVDEVLNTLLGPFGTATNGALLYLLACGSMTRKPESFDALCNAIGRFAFSTSIAFDAERLQPLVAWPFLMLLTEAIVIEGHNATDAVPHALGNSHRLGKHSAVYLMTLAASLPTETSTDALVDVTKYVWSHQDYRPWGQPLPTQCNVCGSAQRWARKVCKDGGYEFRCRYEFCGWDEALGERVRERGMHIVTALGDVDIIKYGKLPDSAWLRMRLPSKLIAVTAD